MKDSWEIPINKSNRLYSENSETGELQIWAKKTEDSLFHGFIDDQELRRKIIDAIRNAEKLSRARALDELDYEIIQLLGKFK